MCGLVGVAGDLMVRDVANFKTLLYISISRGKDSTGVASICTERDNKSERVNLSKEAIPSYRFLEMENSRRWSPIFDRSDIDLLMGHVRWATIGGVDRCNAHPFENDKLVGAHNGTLLNPEFLGSSKTDSEMMIQKMADEGIVDTLEELSPKSAYAVSIFEKGTRKVWFARNNLRGLWVGIHQKRGVIYWASEDRFLDFLDEDLEIFYFSPYYVYEMDIGEIKPKNDAPWKAYKLTDKSKMNDPLEKKVESFYGYGYEGQWWDQDWREYTGTTEPQTQFGTTVRRSKSTYDKDEEKADSDWEEFLEKESRTEFTIHADTDLSESPFDIECLSCEEVIPPDQANRSKVIYEGQLITLCDSCRNSVRDVVQSLGDEEDETGIVQIN